MSILSLRICLAFEYNEKTPHHKGNQLKAADEKLDLCVVIPVYNEEECIWDVVLDWCRVFDKLQIAYKIIIINDGSSDSTGKILDALSKEHKQLQIIHQENSGHGPSIHRGYQEAIQSKADWVFQVDSDDQFLPEDFSRFWNSRQQAEFVLGFREKRHDPLHRLIISKILAICISLFFQARVRDANVPYRLIKSNVLRAILLQIPAQTFAPNIFLSMLGKKSSPSFQEVSIAHKERETGQVSIVRLKLIMVCLRSFRDLIIFRMNLSRKLESIREQS